MFAVFVEVETGNADMDAAIENLKQNVIPQVLRDRDKVMMGLLRTLGIRPGQRSSPPLS